MRYISVCSGIEAASLAWEPLGWEPLAFSEIEPFPCKVLAHRWPTVPNLGDMCLLPDMLRAGLIEAPDVLIGGTPCQAFSVAGPRRGMLDPRGMLSIKFIEVANAIDEQRPDRECIVLWENVLGVLSDKQNAFGCFLGALVGEDCELQPPGGKWSNAGYVSGPQRSAAWRVVDAQYFGVAQRRRRVFVVASARDGFDSAAVLFESEGVRRDTPPSREKGESVTHDIAPSLTSSGRGVERGGDTRGQDPVVAVCMSTGQAGAEIGIGIGTTLNCNHEAPIITTQYGEVAGSLTARHDSSPCADRGMNVVAFEPGQSADSRSIGAQEEIACTLESAGGGNNKQAICYPINTQIITRHEALGRNTGFGLGDENDPAFTLQSGHSHGIAYGWQVRRLTPLETERLQGMPDNHTAIPGAKDGPRYKAIGNSMAVPCIKWLGQRIQKELTV
jgi:DNA (cytosine-5)-methyltransferase 1